MAYRKSRIGPWNLSKLYLWYEINGPIPDCVPSSYHVILFTFPFCRLLLCSLFMFPFSNYALPLPVFQASEGGRKATKPPRSPTGLPTLQALCVPGTVRAFLRQSGRFLQRKRSQTRSRRLPVRIIPRDGTRSIMNRECAWYSVCDNGPRCEVYREDILGCDGSGKRPLIG